MRSFAELEAAIAREPAAAESSANALLGIGEEVLEHWITARGQTPTFDEREGFRLLALHRQGASGDPSFNACRETCRELAYHYNLIKLEPGHPDNPERLAMMQLVANHLLLFIRGKMQVAELGEFCCSSKPIRLTADAETMKT